MLAVLLHRPRQLWLRKALFQIHLWLGILLSLYVIVIALSGSTLVFQEELRLLSLRRPALDPARTAPVSVALQNAHARYPGGKIVYISLPQPRSPWWSFYVTLADGRSKLVYADAATGAPIAQDRKLLIDTILDLHVYLLAGRTGFVVNCAAGIGLLVLALTGALLWWPGVRRWRRALTVRVQSGWRRINYDLHNAVGFWTLFIVSWWGMTAIYFLFPTQFSNAVNVFSPLIGMKPPTAAAPRTPGTAAAPLETILISAARLSPGHVSGVGLPPDPGGLISVAMDLREPGDFTHRAFLTFDGHTGKLLSVWRYGDNRSLGDWFLWLIYPLHFGTVWGLGVKILWAGFGLCLALLGATGLLMYWNRKLSKWGAAQRE